MQILSQNAIGKGFVQIEASVPLKTSDQYFDMATQEWVIGSFFTSDNELNRGVRSYRRPVTLGAKIALLPKVIKKYWNKKIKPIFD